MSLAIPNIFLPPLSALFPIHFDLKVGYTIIWKRALPDVSLDGVVEFKSLPSGLHNVKEDLVYFVHKQYAGISAFVNRPASEAERNAQLVAVGALVPLRDGRLGRGWEHAEGLRELSRILAQDISQTTPLEAYWEQNGAGQDGDEGSGSAISSPILERTLSNASGPKDKQIPKEGELPHSHPARSILGYIETFGPLIFPLHRLALLRKKILLVTHAPVKEACEYVYDLSLLSSIPSSIHDLLPQEAYNLDRVQPLFAIGVHDIPQLEQTAKSLEPEDGWIACTTDEILAQKATLLDIIVELRPINHQQHADRRWPRVTMATGKEVKATQRDFRRYCALRRVLRRIEEANGHDYPDDDAGNNLGDDEQMRLLPPRPTSSLGDESTDESTDEVVEPTSWSALAYNGFMWWASAGSMDAALEKEKEEERELLSDLEELASTGMGRYSDDPQESDSESSQQHHSGSVEMAVVAYFHRLTSTLFSTLSEVVTDDGESEESGENEAIVISSDDARRMGLDVWSETDGLFAAEMVQTYWKRHAELDNRGIECCGMRIC